LEEKERWSLWTAAAGPARCEILWNFHNNNGKKERIHAMHHVSRTGDAAVKFVLVALVVVGGRATTPAVVLVGGAMIVGEVLLDDDSPDESSSFLLLSSFVEGLLADFSEPFPTLSVSSVTKNKVVVVTTTTTRKRRRRRPIDHQTHRFRLSAGFRRRLVPLSLSSYSSSMILASCDTTSIQEGLSKFW
jgi:hypothetical protein